MAAHDPTPLLNARIAELEAAVAQRVSEWDDTLNAISDWVCIIDLNFRIVRTNLAVEQLIGLSREQVLGKPCFDLVHGTAGPISECPIPRMIESLQRAQTEVQVADGRWLSITVDPLTDRDGRLRGAVHMARDITARKAAQAERETLIQQLEQTLSEVKTLKGLIPICATCRRIRDDNGAWNSLEAFIHNNFDADFSHGLCPECAAQVYEAFDL
jgi:PAS domain S-box-containing protein